MIKKTVLLCLSLCAVCLLSGASAAADIPRRIVSFNLCTDQLLLALADPEQIAGLSPYAVNPAMSVMTEKAAPYRKLDWDAESVVNLAPDLVLTAPSHRPISAMLASMGVRVAHIPFIVDIEAAKRQARDVGALVGHPERGEALAREIEAAERKLASASATPSRTALLIGRGGYTEGAASLPSAMLRAAGFTSPAIAPKGFGGFISLERLLIDGPDVVVTQDIPREARDQGALYVTHPAVFARYADRRINLPARYTLCGGPALVQGLNYLGDAVKALR
ncbi:MAG: ABC transporter substrate-binding protein [Pseudomonadota bacterium]